jgi:O-succinylbenzoate synthase
MTPEIDPFEIPLLAPLPGSGERVRRGFYLRMGDGVGEAAPLPGWSRETLEEAASDLARLVRGDQTRLCASVRFAWECALEEQTGWSGHPSRAREVPVNSLDGEIAAAIADGCSCFKFKLSGDPRDMAAMVRQRAATIGGRATIRLDANRRWSLPEAREFLSGIEGVEYQYLEEPLADPDDLPSLMEHPAARIALDETLREITPGDLHRWNGIRAVVLKPTLLGGLRISRDFAEAAARLGAVPVVSASFETRVGLMALARFAASLSDSPEPAGLDTLRWLPEGERPEISGHRIRVA